MSFLDTIINNLKRASTKREIDLVFSHNKISDPLRKIKYLQQVQGMLSFYAPNYYQLSSKEKYEYEVAIFLKGNWKINELYGRM